MPGAPLDRGHRRGRGILHMDHREDPGAVADDRVPAAADLIHLETAGHGADLRAVEVAVPENDAFEAWRLERRTLERGRGGETPRHGGLGRELQQRVVLAMGTFAGGGVEEADALRDQASRSSLSGYPSQRRADGAAQLVVGIEGLGGLPVVDLVGQAGELIDHDLGLRLHHGGPQGIRVAHVEDHRLHPEPAQRLGSLWMSRRPHDVVSSLEELPDERPADYAGRTGDENPHSSENTEALSPYR